MVWAFFNYTIGEYNLSVIFLMHFHREHLTSAEGENEKTIIKFVVCVLQMPT